MHEARIGDFSRSNISTEPGVAFQDANAPPALGEKRRAGQGIDSAPDENRVERFIHRYSSILGPRRGIEAVPWAQSV